MEKRELVLNVMENDRENVYEMTVEQAGYVLDWLRSDDEDGRIPEDFTAEEFAAIWNEIKGLWFAVMMDREDTDWGTGKRTRQEAVEKVLSLRDDYPEAYIAVIDESGSEPMCIEEYRDF